MNIRQPIFLIASLFFLSCSPAIVQGDIINSENLTDGQFTGEAKHSIDKAVVRLTIKNGKVKKCEIVKLKGTKGKSEVRKKIPARIVENQSTDVDAVSGATTLSRTVMNAANEAVKKSEAVKK